MYFGHIRQIENSHNLYPAPIARLLKIFTTLDIHALENKRYDVDGDNIFYAVSEAETKSAPLLRPETHFRYIDVQFLISGNEQIGITVDNGSYPIVENLYEEKDIAFYAEKTPDEVLVRAQAGNFTVIFPDEIHRPCCAVHKPEKIRKIVGKVLRDIL